MPHVLSTAKNGNSNLSKHLDNQQACTKLVAKGLDTSDIIYVTPPKHPRLDFSNLGLTPVTRGQFNNLKAQYVVENIQPLSTFESPTVRQLVKKDTLSTRLANGQ